MRRRDSWLQAVVLFALTGGIGLLAGYGALRLYRDREQAAAPLPSVAQAAAPATPQIAAPEPAFVVPIQPPAVRPDTAKKTSASNRRSTSKSNAAAPPPEAPVSFANPLDEPAEPEPTPKQMPRRSIAPAPTMPLANDSTLRPQYSVALDLTRPRTQKAIEVESKELVIAALNGCAEKFEIKPGTITIQGPREIVVTVSIDRLSGGRTQITLEPTVNTDAGKKLPFTIRNMENVRRQLGQTGETATSQIAAMKLEQKSLDDYIKSYRLRTVAKDDAARARLDALKKLIPAGEKQLVAMKADFDTAEKMVTLAKALHEKCIVVFEEKR